MAILSEIKKTAKNGAQVTLQSAKSGEGAEILQGSFGMSVHPKFQGLGIGKMMLEILLEWAQKNPRIETVRLRVHAKNDIAMALYRQCGFSEEGREIKAVKLRDGSYDDVILMARNV